MEACKSIFTFDVMYCADSQVFDVNMYVPLHFHSPSLRPNSRLSVSGDKS